MSSSFRYTLLYAARVLIYSGWMILINAIFMYDAQNPTSTGKFGEISGTEIMQAIILALVTLLFYLAGKADKSIRAVSYLAAVIFFMSLIREHNNQIDFWFYLVLPFIGLFLYLLIAYRKEFFDSLKSLLEIPATAYLVVGFLVTYVFSRFFGRTSFWQALLENYYHRWAKNAAEEGIELLGYSLILIGIVEVYIAVRWTRKKIK